MDCSVPGFPLLHYLPEFAQTHFLWVGNAIQLCHPLLPPSLVLHLCQHQDLFQWVGSSHQVTKVSELQFQHQSCPWIFRVDFLQDWLVSSPCCPRDSQESSPAPEFKSINSSALSLYGPALTSIHGKTIALTIRTFVSKVMSLLAMCRFVIAFLPRNKCLLMLWLQSQSTVIWEPKKTNFGTISTLSPSICHEVMGPDVIILVFWMLSFKPDFSLSFFTLIRRFFCSSLLSAIRMVSSACLKLLILLWQSWFQLVTRPARHLAWCTLHLSKIA